MAKKSKQPEKSNEKPSKGSRLKFIIGGLLFLALIVAVAIGYVGYYTDKVLPHIGIANASVGGQTLPSAVESIRKNIEQSGDQVVSINQDDHHADVHAADIGLVIDPEKTAADAYQIGRRDQFLRSAWDMASQLVSSKQIFYEVTYDQDKLNKVVADFAATVDQPEVNAGVKIDNGAAVETKGASGNRIDQNELKTAIVDQWKMGQGGKITAVLHKIEPTVSSGNTSLALKQAGQLHLAKVVLQVDNQTFSPKQSVLDAWIGSRVDNGVLIATFNADQVKQWLNTISGSVNQDPSEAKVAMVAGQISLTKDGQEGRALDVDKTAAMLAVAAENYIKSSTSKTITSAAAMTVTKPQVTGDNLNSLGIVELIGTGTTSFAGSPDNRKHNIAVGAAALNGILIKPGEEFSTLKFLGRIDNTSGYLPELVIKEDKTTPEFGGGLCQVSTTLFRATLNTGLKITERRNHRYRVSYYEPPVGMDATIYEGSPDYKFVNDTTSYILVQSHIDGTKLTFDFYGKKDGRTAQSSTPVMSNIVNPPDPEYIQTDTLPVGTTKRTESAHAGADASFTYTVLNSDGSVRNKQTFTSHYTPWQAKYLVGTAAPAPTTTGTP